jgi:uncharacterized protein (DUF3084 family)
MKKNLILLMLISLVTICSCQKQDSATDQELAQRKLKLDSRENALDERMSALDDKVKALDERVKVLAANQKAMANGAANPTNIQGQTLDAAQVQAERERTIQEFSSQIKGLNINASKVKAEREKARQRALQQSQSQRRPKAVQIPSGAVFPAPETGSQPQSSEPETTAATPSLVTENPSPTPSPTPQ